MTRADWLWAISLSLIILASLVMIIITVVHATNVNWLCAHQWTAC